MIYRDVGDGKKWVAVKENGQFVLGDPKFGNRKHLAGNAVRVKDEAQAIELIKKGFSIRVETSARPSLIRKNLFSDGVALT